MKPGEVVYLGDGAYLRHDGFQLVLLANDPIHPTDTVYLEPSVAANLLQHLQDTLKDDHG